MFSFASKTELFRKGKLILPSLKSFTSGVRTSSNSLISSVGKPLKCKK